MRTQKFDPRDDRLQIKEDWALAELGAKVVVILEFFYKFQKINLQFLGALRNSLLHHSVLLWFLN